MTIGLAGAAGTGKSTLAKLIAKETMLEYHDASVTHLMKEAGFNGVANLSIEDRVTAQEKLLELYLKSLRANTGLIITDRTPVDMIGYMLGEITMHNTDAVLGKRIAAYVDKCLEATSTHFDSVIVLRPLPNYQASETRPPLNKAYQLQTQFLIEGALRQIHDLNWWAIWATDLDARLSAAIQLIQERYDMLKEERVGCSLH